MIFTSITASIWKHRVFTRQHYSYNNYLCTQFLRSSSSASTSVMSSVMEELNVNSTDANTGPMSTTFTDMDNVKGNSYTATIDTTTGSTSTDATTTVAATDDTAAHVDSDVVPLSINEKTTILRQNIKRRKKQDGHTAAMSAVAAGLVDEEEFHASVSEGKKHGPKKRYALVVGYVGTAYLGLQYNTGRSTIELELMKGVVAAGYVRPENFDPYKMGMSRCARTDKGVHAASQVVTMNLHQWEVNVEGRDPVAHLNGKLPADIRLLDLIPVANSFNPKSCCSGRDYVYVLPTYALEQTSPSSHFDAYRASTEQIESLKEVARLYIGSKNFHNYTSGQHFSEPNSRRYITNMEVDGPHVQDGLEFVVMKVSGQSFMLNQIRKMVGTCVAVVRGLMTCDDVFTTFSNNAVNLPIIPAVGLFLHAPRFETYNKKALSGSKPPLLFYEEPIASKVKDFCSQYIYPEIIRTEQAQRMILRWSSDITSDDIMQVRPEVDLKNRYTKIRKRIKSDSEGNSDIESKANVTKPSDSSPNQNAQISESTS